MTIKTQPRNRAAKPGTPAKKASGTPLPKFGVPLKKATPVKPVKLPYIGTTVKSKPGEHRWEIRSAKGQAICTSSQTYTAQGNAHRALQKAVEQFQGANFAIKAE